jgi:hypothetical protein
MEELCRETTALPLPRPQRMVRPETDRAVLVIGHVTENVRHRLRRRLIRTGGEVAGDALHLNEAKRLILRPNVAAIPKYRGTADRKRPR